jgi:flagellar basal-body rod modification protein FlgD
VFELEVSGGDDMQIPGSVPTAQVAAADSNDGSSTTQNEATITANDFLTLLVTELKNQDPTANTDPNEYVDQLVQVNSLQQLIQINQNTTTASGSLPGSSGS